MSLWQVILFSSMCCLEVPGSAANKTTRETFTAQAGDRDVAEFASALFEVMAA